MEQTKATKGVASRKRGDNWGETYSAGREGANHSRDLRRGHGI